MGHSEMCLAVAGLKSQQVDAITRQLAGDWSDLTPAEVAALTFTRKQCLDPDSITDDDVDELERHYGPQLAWHIIFFASRSHYMTRVADAFQLPLEKENPFWNMPGARRAT
jgi:alkylhydroperoxidase family enzyme